MNLYIRTEPQGWQMGNAELLRAMGLPRKLPKEAPTNPDGSTKDYWVQGIQLWVDPQVGTCSHRIKARCPACGKVLGVSRLQQHSKVHRR